MDLSSLPSSVILKKAMMKSELAAMEGAEGPPAAVTLTPGGAVKPTNPGRPSIYRGVMWDNGTKCWRAKIKVRARTRYLGVFREEIEAARSYDIAALFLMRDRSTLNFPNADYSNSPLSRVPPDFVEEFVREMHQLRDAGTLYKRIVSAHNASLESNEPSKQETSSTTATSIPAARTLSSTTSSSIHVQENVQNENDASGVFSTTSTTKAGSLSAPSEQESTQSGRPMNRDEMMNRWSMKEKSSSSSSFSSVTPSGSIVVDRSSMDQTQQQTSEEGSVSLNPTGQNVKSMEQTSSSLATTTMVIPSPPSSAPKSKTTITTTATSMTTEPMYPSSSKDVPVQPSYMEYQQQLLQQPPTSHDLSRDPKMLGMYGRATLLPPPASMENNGTGTDVVVTNGGTDSPAAAAAALSTGPGSNAEKTARARELEFKHFRLPLKMLGVKQLGNTGLYRATLDYHSHELFLGDYEFAVDACHAHDLIAVRLFGQYHCREKSVVNCRPNYIPVLARNEFLIPTSLFRLTSQLIKLCPSVANDFENTSTKVLSRRTEMKEALKSVRETYKRRAYDLNHLPKAALTTSKTVLVEEDFNSTSERGDEEEDDNDNDYDEEDSVHVVGNVHDTYNNDDNEDYEQSSFKKKQSRARGQSLRDQIEQIEGEISQEYSKNVFIIPSNIKPRSELLSFSTTRTTINGGGDSVPIAPRHTTTSSTTNESSTNHHYLAPSLTTTTTDSENLASMTLAELAKRAVIMASMRKRVRLSG